MITKEQALVVREKLFAVLYSTLSTEDAEYLAEGIEDLLVEMNPGLGQTPVDTEEVQQ